MSDPDAWREFQQDSAPTDAEYAAMMQADHDSATAVKAQAEALLTREQIAALEMERELTSEMPRNRGHRFVKQFNRGGMEMGWESVYTCECGASFVVVTQPMRPVMYTPVVCDCPIALAALATQEPSHD